MAFYGGQPQSTSTDFLLDRLMANGYSRMQAAAIIGNLQRESGLISNNVNSKEGAYGLMQWRGERFDNLQRFADTQNKPWTDPGVQADFIAHEMRNDPYESKRSRSFMQAQTLDDATAALQPYIRYGDQSLPQRQVFARQAFGNESAPRPAQSVAIADQPRSGAVADDQTNQYLNYQLYRRLRGADQYGSGPYGRGAQGIGEGIGGIMGGLLGFTPQAQQSPTMRKVVNFFGGYPTQAPGAAPGAAAAAPAAQNARALQPLPAQAASARYPGAGSAYPYPTSDTYHLDRPPSQFNGAQPMASAPASAPQPGVPVPTPRPADAPQPEPLTRSVSMGGDQPRTLSEMFVGKKMVPDPNASVDPSLYGQKLPDTLTQPGDFGSRYTDLMGGLVNPASYGGGY